MSSKKIASIIVGIIIVAIAIFLYTKNKKTENNPTTDNVTAGPAKTLLSGKYKLNFPEVKSRSSVSAVPAELQLFVPTSGATNMVAFELTYNDGKKGYMVELTADDKVIYPNTAYYTKVFQSAPAWTYVMGGRTDTFSFLEFQNSQYSVRVSEELTAGQQQTKFKLEAKTN